jgi:hypothetical protein
LMVGSASSALRLLPCSLVGVDIFVIKIGWGCS